MDLDVQDALELPRHRPSFFRKCKLTTCMVTQMSPILANKYLLKDIFEGGNGVQQFMTEISYKSEEASYHPTCFNEVI